MFNLGNAKVDCYTWDETEGKRGSVEISTSIYKYILDHPEIAHVRMMSDSCGGQQKNYHFSSMCFSALEAHPNLHTIDHVYFEPGHSEMESDSVHSKIETKAKNRPVYIPTDWEQLIRLARSKPSPYIVIKLQHDDFLNFNVEQDQFVPEKTIEKGRKKNSSDNNDGTNIDGNTKIKFNDCVWFQYRRSEKNKIFVKTDYEVNGEFMTLVRKRKRGLKKIAPDDLLPPPIIQYNDRLCISDAKKKNLLHLCEQGLVPRAYKNFFELLPSNTSVPDRLAEPDDSEEEG